MRTLKLFFFALALLPFVLLSQGAKAQAFIVCQHGGYQGVCEQYNHDVPNFEFERGPCRNGRFNNCISSVRIVGPVSLIICENANYLPPCFRFDQDVVDFARVAGPCRNNSFNNCITSIRMEPRYPPQAQPQPQQGQTQWRRPGDQAAVCAGMTPCECDCHNQIRLPCSNQCAAQGNQGSCFQQCLQADYDCKNACLSRSRHWQ